MPPAHVVPRASGAAQRLLTRRLPSAPLTALRAFNTASDTTPPPVTTTARPTLRPISASQKFTRPYHATTHPPPPSPFTPTEAAILAAAYTHVPTHGFTPSSLALGARSAGYLDISANILPEGAFSLIQWHLYTQRTALAAQAASILGDIPADEVAARIEALTWARLMGNKDIVGRWQEVCSSAFSRLLWLPQNERGASRSES